MEHEELIRDYVAECDLTAFKSPYLPKTFSKWRRAHLHSSPSLPFLRSIDEDLFPHFLEKVYIQYHTALLQTPSPELSLPAELLEDSATRDSLHAAAAAIAMWSTEIEAAVDILDRAQAYGLYTVPRELAGLYADLQREWTIDDEATSSRLYRFLVHLMAYATDKLSDLTKRHIVNIAAVNLVHAKSSIVYGVVSAYMYGCFPWPVLALLGSQMGFVIGGWLVMKLGKDVSRRVDSSQVRGHLSELKQKFADMSEELKAVNGRAVELIKAAVEGDEESREELGKVLSGFLVKKQDDSVYRLMEQGQGAEEIVFYDDEDWFVMDFAPVN